MTKLNLQYLLDATQLENGELLDARMSPSTALRQG